MIHQFEIKMDGYNTVFSIAFSEITMRIQKKMMHVAKNMKTSRLTVYPVKM